MRKLELLGIFLLGFFCVANPKFVQGEQDNRTYEVSENIHNIGEFLKQQDYLFEVSKICHDTKCFSIDVNDLNRSISLAEEKMLQYIEETKGKEEAIQAKLKGFSITKVLLR